MEIRIRMIYLFLELELKIRKIFRLAKLLIKNYEVDDDNDDKIDFESGEYDQHSV